MINDLVQFRRIVIVAYRLPFRVIRKKQGNILVQNAGGLVSAILSLSKKLDPEKSSSGKVVWIGMGDKNIEYAENNTEFSLHAVKIPKALNDKYYGGFCNNTIWPLFHYFPSRTTYDEIDFQAYIEANNLFYLKIKEVIQPGDFLWIHDYQLFLLPHLVRKQFPAMSIGFFLHIPFPSYELFRLLPRKWRIAVLSGMIGADVIGFHTNDYTQHFIKSIKRTLGCKVDHNNIDIDGRICKSDTFPIGIDFKKFQDACNSDEVQSQKNKLRKTLNDNKFIFSIDRLDYSKGFIFRLKAFERFLEKYPEWHFKVVFNMVVIPSRDTISDYQEMKKEIEALVGRINGKYCTINWRPVIYQYRSMNFPELVAAYNMSDAAFITPLRDGMNLVAKEFVSCQTENAGILILSEMAGAASELNEAILINPADITETADALYTALNMPIAEKRRRIIKMQSRLSRYDVFRWASDIFQSIKEINDLRDKMQVRLINKNTVDLLKNKYLNSEKRLFLFDYDGTLAPIAKLPSMAVISKTTRGILESISQNKRNRIAVISGRDRSFLSEQFRDLEITLVAEHGYFIKYPGEVWTSHFEIDFQWKKKIEPILENYVDRCNGSMIEQKFSSLVWHYRNADEDMANLRIHELRDDLSEILRNEPKLHILECDKAMEIKSVLYDKGSAASEIIKTDKFDFIMAFGDDNTDEDLFKALPQNGISVRVGRKLSSANFNTRNQNELIELIKTFRIPEEQSGS